MKVSLILTCAGKGERAGLNKNKLLFTNKNGITVLEQSFNKFYDSGLINQFIITASKEDFNEISSLLKNTSATIVLGGNTRTESVQNGLSVCNGDIVLIHDGARPFVSVNLIKTCIKEAEKQGGAIPVIPVRNTIVNSNGKTVNKYIGKENLYSVQTPQAFKTEIIKKAFKKAHGKAFNDDGEIYKKFAKKLAIINGEPQNVKLTYPKDFDLLNEQPQYRFGTGFDCHKLVNNKKLILGGIEIPHEKGLLGHSDADVLTHAIMDAMLSACALRDIGFHFPDTDDSYKNADSMELLKKVIELTKKSGYEVQSVCATIMAEKPKLLQIIPKITENLANALNLPLNNVGIGATTLEGLGFVGREEGICVQATATMKSISL